MKNLRKPPLLCAIVLSIVIAELAATSAGAEPGAQFTQGDEGAPLAQPDVSEPLARPDAGAQIADAERDNRIAEIDRALILEYIKLSRFNVLFHIEANWHQPWRQFTYPLGREGGTAVNLGASIADLKQRVLAIESPRSVSRSTLQNIVATAIVGNAISGSASSLELVQNTWIMMRAKKHGYSPKTSLAFVKGVVKTTDALLAERSALVSGEASYRKKRVYEIEDRLFHRIRQQLLSEFRTWSCHSRDQAWRENTFYTVDALQNFTRMASGIYGLGAFNRPHLTGTGIITGTVANGAATVNPILRNLVGLCVRKYQFKKLTSELPLDGPIALPPPTVTLNDLKLAESRLASPFADGTKPLEQAIMLSERSERLDAVISGETREIERYRQIAQQQSISGPLIGLTGLSSSILGTVAWYDYRFDRDVTGRLLLGGRISVITGQSYAVLATPYTIIKGKIRERRLERKGQLPRQQLEERLKNLDALEKQIRSSK